MLADCRATMNNRTHQHPPPGCPGIHSILLEHGTVLVLGLPLFHNLWISFCIDHSIGDVYFLNCTKFSLYLFQKIADMAKVQATAHDYDANFKKSDIEIFLSLTKNLPRTATLLRLIAAAWASLKRHLLIGLPLPKSSWSKCNTAFFDLLVAAGVQTSIFNTNKRLPQGPYVGFRRRKF